VRGTEGSGRVGNEKRRESGKASLKWDDLSGLNVPQIVAQLKVGTLNA
jgi:hypothetical protein